MYTKHQIAAVREHAERAQALADARLAYGMMPGFTLAPNVAGTMFDLYEVFSERVCNECPYDLIAHLEAEAQFCRDAVALMEQEA